MKSPKSTHPLGNNSKERLFPSVLRTEGGPASKAGEMFGSVYGWLLDQHDRYGNGKTVQDHKNV